jgi:hypothetical protein
VIPKAHKDSGAILETERPFPSVQVMDFSAIRYPIHRLLHLASAQTAAIPIPSPHRRFECFLVHARQRLGFLALLEPGLPFQ